RHRSTETTSLETETVLDSQLPGAHQRSDHAWRRPKSTRLPDERSFSWTKLRRLGVQTSRVAIPAGTQRFVATTAQLPRSGTFAPPAYIGDLLRREVEAVFQPVVDRLDVGI